MIENRPVHSRNTRRLSMLAAGAATVMACVATGAVPQAFAADKPEAAPTVASLTTCDTKDVKTIKVGILAPFSGGGMAADANDIGNAAMMAADELNAAGGICGKDARYKVTFEKGDTEGQRSDAVITAVRRLTADPDLHMIFAPYASTTNFEITLMAKAGMPYIISGGAEATKGIISKNPDGFPTVWSRVPDYGGYSTDLPPLINKNIEAGNLAVPAKTVYIIGSDDPYGTTIADGLKDSFTKAGWSVVGTETVPFQSVTDWRTQLAKIRELKPGMIVLTEWSPASDATFFNQFIEQPTDSLLFEQYAPVIPEFNEMTHNKANGVIFNMLGGAIDSRADTKDISKRFAEKFGAGGYFSVAGYTNMMVYALCINKGVDPADHLAMGKCIGSLDVDTPSGRLAFDPKTHLAMQGDDYMPTVFYQVVDNGGKAIVSPPAYAEQTFKQPYWMTTKPAAK
ncbi:ABC transporter substrate-binding protein [Mesorhizobium sp. BR1-1-16]|uniref:ABC transporter substrate-binding protein n=1 Tax=Mesorhizobium sp. BR1-1-16 TaxID=2876653 RepID=UPI001CCABEFF|nr:ABC transporter substrate-binding protein [Mesorhizobium sp. BR1-1-16]MBZ9935608.1 ABC transporter substrate-binding protein [Mesorhizobium sp. BR1-1-16]